MLSPRCAVSVLPSTALFLAFGLALSTGCGDGNRLTREVVVDLPAGDAVGTAASGRYRVELYTRACRGDCPLLAGGTFSLCDVGNVDRPALEVMQADGVLQIDAFGLAVDRLEGGLDADGSFVVGAVGTQYGANVFVRSDGVLAADAITGVAEARAVGSYGGEDFDCTATYELDGVREGD